MTSSLPLPSSLAAYRKSRGQARLDARRYAGEICRLAQELPPMARAVFRAWLKTQARGVLQESSQQAVFAWLVGLHPGLAEAEYRLLISEISWLESFAEDCIHFSREGSA